MAGRRPSDPAATDLIRVYAWPAGPIVDALRAAPAAPARDLALAAGLSVLGRDDEATAVLVSRLDADPLDGRAAGLLAGIRIGAGDLAGAARYGRWAELVGYGSAALNLVSGSTITTVRDAGTSNQATNYPWAVYWRFGPDVLAPPDALAVLDR